MTSDQLEPSAHAPCTSTTLRASTGAVVWAFACSPLSDPVSTHAVRTTLFIIEYLLLFMNRPLENEQRMNPEWREAVALSRRATPRSDQRAQLHLTGGASPGNYTLDGLC